MTRHLPIYLRSLRLQWNLSQAELSHLLGTSKSAVSLLENLGRRPTVDVALGTEVIFGVTPRDAFPALYREIEDAVMARAKELYQRLESRDGLPAVEKRALLLEMIQRAGPPFFET